MDLSGVTRLPLPIGVHGIETVNCYVLADGNSGAPDPTTTAWPFCDRVCGPPAMSWPTCRGSS
jgi:hypothetical protein